MSSLTQFLVDKVAENCIDLYNRLPKNGKPAKNQWTVLSCFLKYDKRTNDIEVVSLGTGSKCIGATKMSPKGDMLNDSHAEIFARRSFIIYLYDNIEKAIKHESSIFEKIQNKFKLKEYVDFIFYSSQLPCGDASIVPKNGDIPLFGDVLQRKRPAEEDDSEIMSKKQKVGDDVHRTGAKCLPNSTQDLKGPGKEYHVLGQARTKPGRGDRTLSMSCSDKIARWIHTGAHGALLDILCDPVRIKYVVIGGGVPYSEETLYRAFIGRNKDYATDKEIVPEFHQSSVEFPNIRRKNSKPTASSIVWVKLRDPSGCKLNLLHKKDPFTVWLVDYGLTLRGHHQALQKQSYKILEVAVQGKKLGVTKKRLESMCSSLCISKYNLYKRFINVLFKDEELKASVIGVEDVGSIPYNVMKKKSERYVKTWLMVKENFFKIWTVKPDIWNFCVDAT